MVSEICCLTNIGLDITLRIYRSHIKIMAHHTIAYITPLPHNISEKYRIIYCYKTIVTENNVSCRNIKPQITQLKELNRKQNMTVKCTIKSSKRLPFICIFETRQEESHNILLQLVNLQNILPLCPMEAFLSHSTQTQNANLSRLSTPYTIIYLTFTHIKKAGDHVHNTLSK